MTSTRRATEAAGPEPGDDDSLATLRAWCTSRGWEPLPFQEEVWRACAAGTSGLLHAPTGTGKTLAAWLGALGRSRAAGPAGLRVVWITPLRALAADTAAALEQPLGDLAKRSWLRRRWRVGLRTGDTSAADRRRLREN